jgi:hypothetical protein
MNIVKTKSIEDLSSKNANQNLNNPNPYLRKYGSHIKSHFSQSRCEIFESSDDETNVRVKKPEQTNSINSLHMVNSSKNSSNSALKINNNSSLQHFDREKLLSKVNKSKYGEDSATNIHNSPSICLEQSPYSPQKSKERQIQENNLQIVEKESLEDDLENNDYDDDNGSQLIIMGSRKSSLGSLKSFDFDTNNLTEPGTEIINKFQNHLEKKDPKKNSLMLNLQNNNLQNNDQSKTNQSEKSTANNSICHTEDSKSIKDK